MRGKTFFFRFIKTLLVAMILVVCLEAFMWSRQVDRELYAPPPLPTDLISKLMETRGKLDRAMDILEQCFGQPVSLEQMRSVQVTLTAYSSTKDQCDPTPHITASNTPVRIGIIAVSRDLMEETGLSFGQRVLIPGHGVFEIRDRMNARWKRKVDIWHNDREAARRFGKQKGILIWQGENSDAAPELIATNHHGN